MTRKQFNNGLKSNVSFIAAQHLANHCTPGELGISIYPGGDSFYRECIGNLIQQSDWSSFKSDVARRYRRDVNDLRARNQSRHNRKERYKQQKQLIREIEVLLLNYALQEKLLLTREIKEIKARAKALAKSKQPAEELKREKRLLREELLSVEKALGMSNANAGVYEENLEKIIEGTEGAIESTSTTTDLIMSSQEAIKHISDVSLSAFEFSRSLPLISDFIRGLVAIAETAQAVRNPQSSQRKVKIATGVFSIGISLSTGIVTSLLLARVALVAATPIILSALTAGVYAAILFRDAYSYWQTRKLNKLKKIALHNELKNVTQQMQQMSLAYSIEEINKQPQFLRLDLNRARVTQEIARLNHQTKEAGNKTLFSACMMVGVSFAVAAICTTGIGAIVLTGLAGLVVVGVTIAKIRRVFGTKHEEQSAPKFVKLDDEINPSNEAISHLTLEHATTYKVVETMTNGHPEVLKQTPQSRNNSVSSTQSSPRSGLSTTGPNPPVPDASHDDEEGEGERSRPGIGH